jgi:hypothetical protein
MRSHTLIHIIILTLLAGLLVACGTGLPATSDPTPTAVATASVVATTTPTVASSPRPATAVPTSTSAPEPTFAFEPRQGGFRTAINLRGSGFPPDAPVNIGVGFPTNGPVLATVKTDRRGAWEAQVTLPELEISPGSDWSQLHLIISDAQRTPLASAPFTFTPSTGPSHEGATQTVRDLLSAYTSGMDVRPYLDTELRARVDSGQSLEQLLALQPAAITSFDVGAPLDRPSEVLFVPATVVYSVMQEQRLFTLVVEDGVWRVNGSFVDAPLPPPTVEGAPQAVRDLLAHFGDGAEAVLPYLSSELQAKVAAGAPVHQLLGLAPMAWEGFTVGDPLDMPSEVLFVPATLTYPTFTEERRFTLVVEEGQWRVTGSAVVQDPAP